jgi:hypothetical protein
MFKVLFIGYLFGVRSERQLMREIEVNIAYRWFLALKLTDPSPEPLWQARPCLCKFHGGTDKSGYGRCRLQDKDEHEAASLPQMSNRNVL